MSRKLPAYYEVIKFPKMDSERAKSIINNPSNPNSILDDLCDCIHSGNVKFNDILTIKRMIDNNGEDKIMEMIVCYFIDRLRISSNEEFTQSFLFKFIEKCINNNHIQKGEYDTLSAYQNSEVLVKENEDGTKTEYNSQNGEEIEIDGKKYKINENGEAEEIK